MRFGPMISATPAQHSQHLLTTVVVFLQAGDSAGLHTTLDSLTTQTHSPTSVLLVGPPGQKRGTIEREFSMAHSLDEITQLVEYPELPSTLVTHLSELLVFLHSGTTALPQRCEHAERLLRLHPVGAILSLPLLPRYTGLYPKHLSQLFQVAEFKHGYPLLKGRQLLDFPGGLAESDWLLDCLTIRSVDLCARLQRGDLSIFPAFQRCLNDCQEVLFVDSFLTSCATRPSVNQLTSHLLPVPSSPLTDTPLISVIVPCWNVENYLAVCLDSIKAQSFDRYELICVDDGSTDATPEILESYARLFGERMRIVTHLVNTGIGEARNTGISHALGEYLASVDADDWIDEGMLELLYQGATESAADIVNIGYKTVSVQGTIHDRHQYIYGIREISEYDNIFSLCMPSFCNKLWRRTLFTESEIAFPPRVYYEDLATTPRLLAVARKICFLEGCPYNYRQRRGSTMQSTSLRHLTDYLKVFDILRDHFSTRLQSSDLFRLQFCDMVANSLMYSILHGGGGGFDRSTSRAFASFGIGYIEHLQRLYGRIGDQPSERLASVLCS